MAAAAALIPLDCREPALGQTCYVTVAGYGVHPTVLLRLEQASFEDLDEALTEAWLARASRRLRAEFLP